MGVFIIYQLQSWTKVNLLTRLIDNNLTNRANIILILPEL